MAVRIFGRFTCPLTQCLKYSVSNNSAVAQRAFLINVRRCQTVNNKPVAGSQSADKNAGTDITLVSPNGERSRMKLKAAQSIANRKNCELISYYDEDDCTIVYRFIPLGTLNKSEEKNAVKKVEKRPKEIEITTTTTERDLMVKCKKIVKMVQNNHKVRVHLHTAEQVHKTTKTPEQEVTEIIKTAIKDFGTMRQESRGSKKTILVLEPHKTKEAQAKKEGQTEQEPQKKDETQTKDV